MVKILDKLWKLAVLASAFAVAIGAGAWLWRTPGPNQPAVAVEKKPVWEQQSSWKLFIGGKAVISAFNESRKVMWDQSPEVVKQSPLRVIMLNGKEFNTREDDLRNGK